MAGYNERKRDILGYVENHPGATASEVASALDVEIHNARTLLHKYNRRGLLSRRIIDGQKTRAYEITEKGLRRLEWLNGESKHPYARGSKNQSLRKTSYQGYHLPARRQYKPGINRTIAEINRDFDLKKVEREVPANAVPAMEEMKEKPVEVPAKPEVPTPKPEISPPPPENPYEVLKKFFEAIAQVL